MKKVEEKYIVTVEKLQRTVYQEEEIVYRHKETGKELTAWEHQKIVTPAMAEEYERGVKFTGRPQVNEERNTLYSQEFDVVDLKSIINAAN